MDDATALDRMRTVEARLLGLPGLRASELGASASELDHGAPASGHSASGHGGPASGHGADAELGGRRRARVCASLILLASRLAACGPPAHMRTTWTTAPVAPAR